MSALSEYSNVYNSALLILKAKGFQVWYDKEADLYGAERDGWDFLSGTPCGLLGLVAIYEFKRPKECGEYWWKVEGEDMYGNLPDQPSAYRPVWERKKV